MKLKAEKKGGFTLVEMMVAIAVFSIVMVTAMSALLNVVDANNKAHALKTAINNISFALEGISKDMRVGTDYKCLDASADSYGNCPGGGTMIRYKSPRAYQDPATGDRKFAYYKFEGTQIWECLEKNVGDDCTVGTYRPITSNELTINQVEFYVLGVQDPIPSTNITQPRMILTVKGLAGTKAKIQTTFDLQTSVSQRLRPKSL